MPYVPCLALSQRQIRASRWLSSRTGSKYQVAGYQRLSMKREMTPYTCALHTFSEIDAPQREVDDSRILLFNENIFREPLEMEDDVLR